jgi:hypothetical protein
MTSKQSPQIILPHLNWSLARLKEAIEKEDTDYYRGAALQRFSLTYEVALKAIRAFAEQEGKSFSSDESCFQWIEEKKWFKKKSDWITVIQNYKKVKNLPKEKSTGNAYSKLRDHYLLFNDINESLNIKLSNTP